jgi:hypothetical protein
MNSGILVSGRVLSILFGAIFLQIEVAEVKYGNDKFTTIAIGRFSIGWSYLLLLLVCA